MYVHTMEGQPLLIFEGGKRSGRSRKKKNAGQKKGHAQANDVADGRQRLHDIAILFESIQKNVREIEVESMKSSRLARRTLGSTHGVHSMFLVPTGSSDVMDNSTNDVTRDWAPL